MSSKKISTISGLTLFDLCPELFSISPRCAGKALTCKLKVNATGSTKIENLIESLGDLTIEKARDSPILEDVAKSWHCTAHPQHGTTGWKAVHTALKTGFKVLGDRRVLEEESNNSRGQASAESSSEGTWNWYQSLWYDAEKTKRSVRDGSTKANRIPWPVASGSADDVTAKTVESFFDAILEGYTGKKALAVLRLEVARWDRREFADCFGELEKGMLAGEIRTVRAVLGEIVWKREVKEELWDE